jgi:hypothetical protein
MALWDRLKDGIDKVERVASDALDEGKTRIDARKARQTADKAAEALATPCFAPGSRGGNSTPRASTGSRGPSATMSRRQSASSRPPDPPPTGADARSPARSPGRISPRIR